MGDRSIILRLRAEVSDAISGLDRTAKAAEKVGTATEQASKKSKFSLDGTAASIRKNEEHYNRLGNGALVAGGLIATGIGFGVKAFADFDEAMSQASASLPGAGAEMGKLRQLAIDLGKDTKFSSTEAAQGITELAKAGVSAADIYGGGLKGALDLAAAGGLDVARAAEIAGIAVKQFNLQGSDVPHVADLFAAAAGKAVGSVDDIAQAMKYAGITASSLGIGMEETTGVIGLFAEKGIIGEQAGTSFRSMLLSLTAPSQVGRKAMEELGISVFDSSGKFVGLEGAAEALKQKLGPLDEATRTAALGQIFGNESISAAIELYKAGGSGVADWTAKVNDAGFAAEQAAKLTDNLKGDVERFTGALDAVAVQNGGGLNDFLRSLTQNAEGAVESFGRLPGPVQQGVLGLGALVGVGLLAFGAISKVVTSGANLIESLDAISTKSPRAASALGKVGKAAGILAALLAAGSIADAAFGSDGNGIGSEQLTKSLLGNADAVAAFNMQVAAYQDKTGAGFWNVNEISDYSDALDAAFNPSKVQQADNMAAAFVGLFGIENQSAITRSSEVFDSLDATLSNLARSGSADVAAEQFKQFAAAAKEQGVSVEQLMEVFPQYKETLAGLDNEQTLAAGSGDKLTGALDETGEAAAKAEDDLKKLVDQIRGFGSQADAARSAESGFQAAIDDAAASLKENGKTLDLHTEKGRANDAALRGIAQAAKDSAAETFNLSGSMDAATAKIQEGRDAFIAQARATGLSKVGAEALADALGLIPAKTEAAIAATGATEATAEVLGLKDVIFRLDGKVVTVAEAGKAKPSKDNVVDLDAAILGLKGKTVKVEELGTNASGERVVRFQGKIYALKGKTVGVAVTVAGMAALDTAAAKIARLQSKRINIGVNTNYTTSGSRSTAGGLTRDNADGGMHERFGGALVQSFANGGDWDGSFGSAQPQIRAAGGRGIRWAEEGAGPWEAFISGHPAKADRSRMITEDLVGRLGGQVQWMKAFADGGIRDRYASRPMPMRQTNDFPIDRLAALLASSTGGSETVDQRIGNITVHANTWEEIEAKARAKQRLANLGRRRA